ncbi:MAG TPA: hypothetical protein VGM84_06000 [Steroidobacteraceae bacterium]|jgi:hypothetical protein
MKTYLLENDTVRRFSVLIAAAALGGLNQAKATSPPEPLPFPRPPGNLTGLLSDYSPAHVNNAPVKGAPYEMRGRWSLEFQRHLRSGVSATFSAALNMETTDAGAVNQDDPTTRGAHTHHITMTGPVSSDTSSCPANDPNNPPIAWHFQVSGQAHITGNGNQAPFQVKSGTSLLTVCVGGGSDGTLEFSNITLVLGAPANTHFGPQPIHGVVTKCSWGPERQSSDCTLAW